jgi:uncharacterized protein
MTNKTTNPVISEDLLAKLVCPADHGALTLEGEHLRCTVCGRVYPIVDGIPHMLVPDE